MCKMCIVHILHIVPNMHAVCTMHILHTLQTMHIVVTFCGMSIQWQR